MSEMNQIQDFKDLRIWQKGMDIAKQCYFLTKRFPKDELYGMVQQIRRSASSDYFSHEKIRITIPHSPFPTSPKLFTQNRYDYDIVVTVRNIVNISEKD